MKLLNIFFSFFLMSNYAFSGVSAVDTEAVYYNSLGEATGSIIVPGKYCIDKTVFKVRKIADDEGCFPIEIEFIKKAEETNVNDNTATPVKREPKAKLVQVVEYVDDEAPGPEEKTDAGTNADTGNSDLKTNAALSANGQVTGPPSPVVNQGSKMTVLPEKPRKPLTIGKGYLSRKWLRNIDLRDRHKFEDRYLEFMRKRPRDIQILPNGFAKVTLPVAVVGNRRVSNDHERNAVAELYFDGPLMGHGRNCPKYADCNGGGHPSQNIENFPLKLKLRFGDKLDSPFTIIEEVVTSPVKIKYIEDQKAFGIDVEPVVFDYRKHGGAQEERLFNNAGDEERSVFVGGDFFKITLRAHAEFDELEIYFKLHLTQGLKHMLNKVHNAGELCKSVARDDFYYDQTDPRTGETYLVNKYDVGCKARTGLFLSFGSQAEIAASGMIKNMIQYSFGLYGGLKAYFSPMNAFVMFEDNDGFETLINIDNPHMMYGNTGIFTEFSFPFWIVSDLTVSFYLQNEIPVPGSNVDKDECSGWGRKCRGNIQGGLNLGVKWGGHTSEDLKSVRRVEKIRKETAEIIRQKALQELYERNMKEYDEQIEKIKEENRKLEQGIKASGKAAAAVNTEKVQEPGGSANDEAVTEDIPSTDVQAPEDEKKNLNFNDEFDESSIKRWLRSSYYIGNDENEADKSPDNGNIRRILKEEIKDRLVTDLTYVKFIIMFRGLMVDPEKDCVAYNNICKENEDTNCLNKVKTCINTELVSGLMDYLPFKDANNKTELADKLSLSVAKNIIDPDNSNLPREFFKSFREVDEGIRESMNFEKDKARDTRAYKFYKKVMTLYK